jgi:hypothetical protein
VAKIGGRTKKRTIHRTIPGRKGHSPALRKRCIERVVAGETPDAVARSEGVSASGIKGWVRDKDQPVKAPRKLKPQTREFCKLVVTPKPDGSMRTIPEAYCEAYGRKRCSGTDDYANSVYKREAVQAQIAKDRSKVDAERFKDEAKPAIAVQAARIQRRQRDWDRLERLKDQRAADAIEVQARIIRLYERLETAFDDEDVAHLRQQIADLKGQIGRGEDTGLLCTDKKELGGVIVPVYKFDKAVLDAQLEMEVQTAKELGQFIDKKELKIDLRELSNEQIKELLADES